MFNLGSIIERFLFAPIVSNLFIYISKFKVSEESLRLTAEMLELIIIISTLAFVAIYCYGEALIGLFYGSYWLP